MSPSLKAWLRQRSRQKGVLWETPLMTYSSSAAERPSIASSLVSALVMSCGEVGAISGGRSDEIREERREKGEATR